MHSDLYKKEFSIGQMISAAWKYFKDNFITILQIILIVYIPINIIIGFVPDITLGGTGFAGADISIQIGSILDTLLGIIATIAIILLIKTKTDNKNILLKDLFKNAFNLWPKAIATNIILGILILLLTILLIIPGIIFAIFWIFAVYVVVVHNKRWMAALKESKAIVQGRRRKVLGYCIVFGLIATGISFVAGTPLLLIPSNAITDIFTNTWTDLVSSFFTVLFIVFFLNFDANRVAAKAKK